MWIRDSALNDKGEVDLDEGYVSGKAADVFGAKIYESTSSLEMCIRDSPLDGSQQENLHSFASVLGRRSTEEVVQDVGYPFCSIPF